MGKHKQKLILPPELPPEVPDDEIEFSDEDERFVKENRDYAGFLSNLDTKSITKQVRRVADVKEDALEALYEKRRKKEAALQQQKEQEKAVVEVDPVDALPVKTLDGQLYYRTLPKPLYQQDDGGNEDGGGDSSKGSVLKLTKAERRAKLKKSKKEAKRQGKELSQPQAVEEAPQAAVLAEVKEELTTEEALERKRCKLAELGDALLADPESNISSLKELLSLCRDAHHSIVRLGLITLASVFRDIIPGYRIRLPTEKELEMKVSKDVKKMRNYESALLSGYKAYLQKLITLEKVPSYLRVAIRCICKLLDAAPHFNFRESLIEVVCRNLTSSDDPVRKLCCDTIKSLFSNEGKHGGEVTVEAVRLIADLVKLNNCQMHPDSIEVFMCLSFDEDLGRAQAALKDKVKSKKNRKGKISEETNQPQDIDRYKKNRKQLVSQMREEVAADYKAAAFTPDVAERRKMQSETLAAVFETYFRILKHTMQSITPRPGEDSDMSVGRGQAYPLLAPCLNGLGKFSHLLDLDYIGDLMNYLKRLASGDHGLSRESLTISERLRCCIIAFRFMRNNLDALNVDLHHFFVQLYNIILEYRPERDQGEVLAEALKMMLCDDRQHDMQKAAAFIKRLATFSLCFGSAESMAALVTLKHLLVKNAKCRILLENDAGGGSVSGSVARYQPYATDPNQSGALSSVLWELDLLLKHYHPSISSLASGVSNMSQNQAPLAVNLSPQSAFTELSLERESAFNHASNVVRKSSSKRKRGGQEATTGVVDVAEEDSLDDEDSLRRKLCNHFTLAHEFKENERLRRELTRTTLSLQLYDKYKVEQQQQRKKGRKTKA